MRDEPIRRIWVLASGLPPEANAWRKHAWPLPVEFQAFGLEHFDRLLRSILDALLHKEVSVPGAIEIRRPGEEQQQEQRRHKASPSEVLAFFGRHFGRK